jgi:hypothetical protein
METVRELVTEIAKGQLQLPEFQRGYVWNRDQVRALIESMYRKRPTGHLLVWHAYRDVATRGPHSEPDTKALLLLDGQQRLTSLYVLIKGTPPPFYEGEDLFFDLYFNLATEEFRFYQKSAMANDPTWLSVHTVLRDGSAVLLDRLAELPQDQREAILRHAGRLGRLDQIRDYPYQRDELKDENLTIDEVIDIFTKVNSAGTELRRSDLALAHVCASWPEARAELRTFSTEMARYGFDIDLENLIRAVAGAAGGTVNFTSQFYNIPSDDLRAAWPKVRKSYEYLVNILRHHAYIDTIHDLPTPLVLVPVLVYLARRDCVFENAVERDRFLRWMLLANVWSRYAGQTDSKLTRDVRALASPDPTVALVAEILADRGRIELEAKDLEGKGSQTAIYRLGYIVARARDAQDWFSGTTLYSRAIGKSNGLESHHIFPRDVLRKNGYDGPEARRIVNELANRAFLTKRANLAISNRYPNTYLPKVEKNFPGALKAQSVPLDRDLWKIGNYELFLHERRKLLAKVMNQFLRTLAHGSISDAGQADVAQLLHREEDQHLEFKSSLRWDHTQDLVSKDLEKVVAKTIAGFLNAAGGGTLLLGVSDDRRVVGLEKDYASLQKAGRELRDTFLLHLTNLVGATLGQAEMSCVTATCHSVAGRDVCQVAVAESDHPVYVNDTLYLRQGNQTRALALKDAVRYVESRWGEGPKGYIPPLAEEVPDDAGDVDISAEDGAGGAGWVEGVGAFAAAIGVADVSLRSEMRRFLVWVTALTDEQLVGTVWSHGGRNPTVIPVPVGDRFGFVTLCGSGSVYLYRGVLERVAPGSVPGIEQIIAPVRLGQGRVVRLVPDDLLAALRAAFREAAARADEAARLSGRLPMRRVLTEVKSGLITDALVVNIDEDLASADWVKQKSDLARSLPPGTGVDQ